MGRLDRVGVGTARELACFLKIYKPATPDQCVPGNPITLLPEEEIPVTADICLRCHVPTGWMEGRSEPASPHFPYLRGQFRGGKFTEYPGWRGAPQSADLTSESETDMEGVQCGFCHRTRGLGECGAGARRSAALWFRAGRAAWPQEEITKIIDQHHGTQKNAGPNGPAFFC
ncbi:MAG: hypothetical protein AB1461_10400 [Thermodesulfobacteriota bacterium]